MLIHKTSVRNVVLLLFVCLALLMLVGLMVFSGGMHLHLLFSDTTVPDIIVRNH